MKKHVARKARAGLLFCGLNLGASVALANNGAELSANGPTAAGMGGVSIAVPQGTTTAVDNPAGMSEVGNQIDFFAVAVAAAANSTFVSPENHQFSRFVSVAPQMGFNYQVAPKWTFGVSVTGAGLASKYGEAPLPVPGASIAKASLLIINAAPTVTYKPLPNLSVGASIVLAVMQFRASGLIAPGPTGPIAIPSRGNSYATGIGAGFGVLWTPIPMMSVGASYYTKTRFTALSHYKDDILAPSGGHLDMPSKYGVGIAIRPLHGLTLGADYLRILWSGAAGVNMPASFNWHDQNVVRIGVAYDINQQWTVRAGYSFANSFIDSDHTLANYYANGITDRSVTAGATYNIDKKNSITFAVEYDIPRTVIGTGPSTGTNISANSQWYSIGYTHKF
ncbi:outer membrane protein transport protein [Burkholderia anthina]|uniref:OmpP1/FadL family transporter n=1 Tax=Burkholderia anthina TaxID=179879 RepID=UPI00158AFC3E|nr:porin [Burkholderia anthina]MBY4867744.1 outer membrane protein transport protein [Burkholderia anthina]